MRQAGIEGVYRPSSPSRHHSPQPSCNGETAEHPCVPPDTRSSSSTSSSEDGTLELASTRGPSQEVPQGRRSELHDLLQMGPAPCGSSHFFRDQVPNTTPADDDFTRSCRPGGNRALPGHHRRLPQEAGYEQGPPLSSECDGHRQVRLSNDGRATPPSTGTRPPPSSCSLASTREPERCDQERAPSSRFGRSVTSIPPAPRIPGRLTTEASATPLGCRKSDIAWAA